MIYLETKNCVKCKEVKSYSEFNKNRSKKDGHASECKSCTKKYREENKSYFNEKKKEWVKNNGQHIKQYRKDNKERDKQKAKEWYETEKGRAFTMTRTTRYRSRKKMLEAKFTAQEWIECMETFDNKCCYCGKRSRLSLEQDHFVPVNSGGPLVKSNIVPACRSCNASKSDKDFFEWYPTNKNYSYERMDKILKYLNIDKNTILIVDKK